MALMHHPEQALPIHVDIHENTPDIVSIRVRPAVDGAYPEAVVSFRLTRDGVRELAGRLTDWYLTLE